LVIVDAWSWDNELEHLYAIQEKLNCYMAFIESGEVLERLKSENVAGLSLATPVKISIIARFPLPVSAAALISAARMTLAQAGYELVHEVRTNPSTNPSAVDDKHVRGRKSEARRIRADGGVENRAGYNKINSPGEKLLVEDGE
jgi:hypothetical protein